jgi:hypothetical protein
MSKNNATSQAPKDPDPPEPSSSGKPTVNLKSFRSFIAKAVRDTAKRLKDAIKV